MQFKFSSLPVKQQRPVFNAAWKMYRKFPPPLDSIRWAIQGQGLWEGGPAGTLLRGPTATEGRVTEETFECLLLTNLK